MLGFAQEILDQGFTDHEKSSDQIFWYICLSAGFLKTVWTDFDETWWCKRGAWTDDKPIMFWCQTGIRRPIQELFLNDYHKF